MKSNTVQRSLYYYDLYALIKNEKTEKFDRSFKGISDFLSNLHDEQAAATGYKDFLKPTRNSNNFLVIVDSIKDTYIEFRIILCRTDALPYIEKDGNLEQLGDYIDSDQNIAEITHCVYFNKYGIMGAEYNFSGCRPTAIADYLLLSEIEADQVTCRPKLNYDAYSKIIAGEEFSLFDFAVKSDSDAYNKMLAQKSIFKTIRAEVPDTDTIEVVLRKRKTKKNKRTGFTAPLSQEEIKELLEKYRDDITRFNVSQDALSDSIDLLSDKLVNKVDVIRTSERTIDSKDVYKKIHQYFDSTVVKYCS